MGLSIGQAVQNWLLRNEVDVTSDMFVPLIDLSFRNEMRKRGYARSPRSSFQNASTDRFEDEVSDSRARQTCSPTE